MLSELDVLKVVAEGLNNSNIAYMVTGSMAMNYYALPRMTRDIDIVIDLNSSNYEAFYGLFKNDFYIDLKSMRDAINNKGLFNIINSAEIIKIDFIIYKDIGFRQIEFQRRKKIKIDDFEAYFASIEDLILSKLIWAKPSHSELQLKDVKNLIRYAVDKDYLNQWAENLGVKKLLKEVSGE